MPVASFDHPIETPVRRTHLKIGTTTATEVGRLTDGEGSQGLGEVDTGSPLDEEWYEVPR